MTAELLMLSPGPLASIQDQGRFGFRRIGVPQSGVIHPEMAGIANALAGNNDDAALIEFFMSGPSFRLEKGSVRLAFAGDFKIELTRDKIKHSFRSWRTLRLQAGDTVQVGPILSGKVGYVAISGGINVPPVMGSRSTYLRAGFGGLDGDRLHPETMIPLNDAQNEDEADRLLPIKPEPGFFGMPPASDEQEVVPVRVVLGPQDDYFTEEALALFLSATYTVSRNSDRMGSRLEGPTLVHDPDKKPEIVSDGIAPGAIQVPGNGTPIALLIDGPTVGGYPKIATIISADLARFSVMNPGSRIRFDSVTAEQAESLARTRQTELEAMLQAIVPVKLRGKNLAH